MKFFNLFVFCFLFISRIIYCDFYDDCNNLDCLEVVKNLDEIRVLAISINKSNEKVSEDIINCVNYIYLALKNLDFFDQSN